MSSPETPLSRTPSLSGSPKNMDEPADEDFRDPPVAPAANPTADMDNDVSDAESVLSDVDEAQFEDFDPNQITIEERPAVAVDEDTVKLIGRHKRKRTEGEVEGEVKKKKKEGRREKVKKNKKKDSDDDFSGAEQLSGKRLRKKKDFDEEGVEGGAPRPRKEKPSKPREPSPEDETLTPDERRRRALDRAMDLALKNPSKRRKKAGEIDLAQSLDDEIAHLRSRMAEAADLDVQARQSQPPRPAMHKLKMLPEVTAILNRNSREVENAVVDPENNLLESVRFFLEPLSDGSLPAYNIQRELITSLGRLPIDKECLIASSIGKIMLFYTKSKKPELSIRRMADKLVTEWSRPILRRTDDYRKRVLAEADYDAQHQTQPENAGVASQLSQAQRDRLERERILAPPVKGNRARTIIENKTYTVVPKASSQVQGGMFARPLGASGEDAFRRMKQRQLAAAGATKRNRG